MLVGDLHIWLREYLVGIRPKKPGFREILLSPSVPERLASVTAFYQSRRGEIRSSWVKKRTGFRWEITIPFNTQAEFRVPGTAPFEIREADGTITKPGKKSRCLELGCGI